jgi:hypothetical protein
MAGLWVFMMNILAMCRVGAITNGYLPIIPYDNLHVQFHAESVIIELNQM